MEQYITPERTANAIMQDSSYHGYYLIVEGKKDHKLYGKFINESEVRIKSAFSKQNVENIMNILDQRAFTKRIGIIDSDFGNLLKIENSIKGLFATDDHDIEVMILKTKALENVLRIYCDSERITQFETDCGKTIRDVLFSLGKEVGYLKYANYIFKLGLIFKPSNPEGNQIRYGDLVCNKTFCYLGHENLISAIIDYTRSKNKNLADKETIKRKLAEVEKQDFDLSQLVNGHDLCNFLYVLIKKIFKSNSRMLNDFGAIEDSLILAYEYTSFQNTRLYKEMLDWSNVVKLQLFQKN